MVIKNFTFSNIPRTYFGIGAFSKLSNIVVDLARESGTYVLILTGTSFFKTSRYWDLLTHNLKERRINYIHYSLCGEPSPDFVDSITMDCIGRKINAVVSIGGGSVIDAGKAVSAMNMKKASVVDYMEAVGDKVHDGTKVPFIAVPTTAGTGSEATKNAVLSRIGENGFKRSFRHDAFIPDYAIIDPELTITCPKKITIACGMDAFTQLLESYVSTGASPITDSLALSGLKYIKECLLPVCIDSSNDVQLRSGMSYAAFLSGITLANAGLGVVHGLAAELGGYFDIPHGSICATLIGAATRMNIKRLSESGNGSIALEKYAKVGEILGCNRYSSTEDNTEYLAETIDGWTERLEVPRLRQYGFKEEHIDKVLKSASCKSNPATLGIEDMRTILSSRM